jgi:hypothetical protein
MAPPVFRAKVVTTVVVGALGVGVFAGVSNDGRGAEPAVVDRVDEPTSTTTITTVSPSSTPSSFAATTITPAEPAVPDPTPTRARVRSGGS